MHPTGSNNVKVLEHRGTPTALAVYDTQLCGTVSELVLRNRDASPFGFLSLLDERSRPRRASHPSPGRSNCRTANAVHAQHRRQRMRLSPLAAALGTDRRNAGFQTRPGESAVHPFQKDLAARLARLAVAFKVRKGQLPKALHVAIPPKRRNARQQARPGCTMPRPKSGCIQRFSRGLSMPSLLVSSRLDCPALAWP